MKYIFFFCIFFSLGLLAQPAEYRLSREEYIEKYKDEAIREMNMNGIPASITLAQALVETGDGNSPLAKYANNHFGIKCHGWKEFSYSVDDDAANECFRKYANVDESYRDHSKFLMTRPWYKPLFELRITDFEGWAKGLKTAGYATHPEYAEMLIKIIVEYKLYELDHLDTLARKGISNKIEHSVENLVKSDYIVASRLKHIIAKPGDSWTRLALKYNISLRKLHEYNDLDRDIRLLPGMIIFLEPKQVQDADIEYHLVMNESVYEIAQIHGIKMSSLLEMNPWIKEGKIQNGDILRLNNNLPQFIESPAVAMTTAD